jgi:hypothetical protein
MTRSAARVAQTRDGVAARGKIRGVKAYVGGARFSVEERGGTRISKPKEQS